MTSRCRCDARRSLEMTLLAAYAPAHSHVPESHPLAMNLTVAYGSTPLPAAHLSLRRPQHLSALSDSRRYAAERGSAIPTPPTTRHTRTAYTPNRRHDSASGSATYPPTRPRPSRLLLSAISPAPRRQSGSAHRAAPGRSADLRSLSRPLPLRSYSSCHRSRTASCPGRSSPSASST